ncbi:hypothetical protein N0V91_002037 [Didymella pomorum]|uniref:Uncharacterized protein n=1 Tax=Didymella pomorum TaxID=749634 RepID=A0A9W8ZJR1_9PLEO|nr:hypothetical protein N0V91_002037 [Didymella pomorum]
MLLHHLIAFTAAVGSVSALDPLKDFCRLHSHRTAVFDRKLYIDGGFVNWAPLTASSVNETGSWLRVGNFDTPDLGFLNQPTLAKNESIPSVSSGILWPDTANKIIYAYGGEQEDSETPDERLWAHDVVYNTRNVSTPERILSVGQASWGAGATASDKALGYCYGGRPTNATETTILSTMIVYDI